MSSRQFLRSLSATDLARSEVKKVVTQKKPLRLFKTFGRSTPYNGSSLVQRLIKTDDESKMHYDNYLKAYQAAEELFQAGDYLLAKIEANKAFSQLTEVSTITAALGQDFIAMRSLLDRIEEKMSDSGLNHPS